MNLEDSIHLVVCEGNDDQRLMEMLAEHHGIAGKLHFRHYAESGTLRSFLGTLAKSPDFRQGRIKSILVTADADDRYDSAWQRVSDAVKAAFDIDLSAPGSWKANPNGPKVAAWVNPAPDKNGMLETLCLEAARETHAEIFPCIDNFLECVEKARGAKLHEKAKFFIWSIVAQGPGAQDRLSLQKALEKLPPNWDSPVFAPLREALDATVS